MKTIKKINCNNNKLRWVLNLMGNLYQCILLSDRKNMQKFKVRNKNSIKNAMNT